MINRLVADFEMSYTTSFRHTAKIKYGVEFTNSDLPDIILHLKKLKKCIETNTYNNKVHVGYDFGLNDVEHILEILSNIITEYSTKYSIDSPPSKKIYSLIEHIRKKNAKSPSDLAREVISGMISTPSNHKKSKKIDQEEKANQLSIARALKNTQK
jgi:hypothetical protein